MLSGAAMRALVPARVRPPVAARSARRAPRPRAPPPPCAAKGGASPRKPLENSEDPKVQKLLEAFRATAALSLRSVAPPPDWLAELLPDAELLAVMRRDPDLSTADPAAAKASLDTLKALVGPEFDALRMAEIYPSLLRQAPETTREMYDKVGAFYGSVDVRETVFLRPDLLHGNTAKLMVEWAKERDKREKRKPKKKKKAAAAQAKAKEDSDSEEDDDDDDGDDDIIDIEDSDEEDTPEEVAQAAQEASAAARRAAEAFKEMGLPAPRGFGGAPGPAAAAPAPAAPVPAAAAAKPKAKAKEAALPAPPLAADEIDEADVIDAGDSDDELTEEAKQAFEADLLAAEKRARAAMALVRDDEEDDSPLSAAVARVEARTLRSKVRVATAKGETVKPAGKPKKVKGKDSERRRKRELQQSPWLRAVWASKKKDEDD